jgi:hypothetical protein
MNNSGVYKITEQTPKPKKIADLSYTRKIYTSGSETKTYNKSLSMDRRRASDVKSKPPIDFKLFKPTIIPRFKNTSVSKSKIPRAQNPMMSSKNSLKFSDILDKKIDLKSTLMYRQVGKSIEVDRDSKRLSVSIEKSVDGKDTGTNIKPIMTEKKKMIIPKIPISEKKIKDNINKEYFVAKYKKLLKMTEAEEIRIIKDVYFLGLIQNRSDNGVLKEEVESYDDTNGNYNIRVGDHINYRYEILSELGQGSFGQAIKCLDHKTKEKVCVKIIKNKKKFAHQARIEINLLNYINKNDGEGEGNMVKMIDNFVFRGHIVN